MEQNKTGGATNKADNLEKPTANNTANMETNAEATYPNAANDSKGAGSPYGGTQSANSKGADGNQQINHGTKGQDGGDAMPSESRGEEYDSQSSYGDQGDDKKGDDNGGTDARGSGVS